METPKSYDTTVPVTKISSGNQSIYLQKSIEDATSEIEKVFESANVNSSVAINGYANIEGTLKATMFLLVMATIKIEEVK